MSLASALHQVILAMLQGVGLLAIIAVVIGTLRRSNLGSIQQSFALGALFGFAALLLSTLSYGSQLGLVLDGRFMCVGLAAAFGGLPALGAAAALSALGQDWTTDAVGLANIFGPVLTGFVALYWHGQIQPRFGSTIGALVALGLMLAVPLVLFHNLSANGVRPPPLVFWLAAAAASVLLSLMIGLFLEREKGILSRERTLLNASLRDPLTGLHNRRSFDAELVRVLARPGNHYLLYADVDHFKTVNDRYGHGFGDEVLCAISRAMSLCVRHDDLVARIGGEEFGIILPDITRDTAQNLAERLLKAVADCDLRAEGEQVTITISIGAARRKSDHSAITLMSVADSALYEAKNLGRRRVAFCEEHRFDPSALPEPANDSPDSEATAV